MYNPQMGCGSSMADETKLEVGRSGTAFRTSLLMMSLEKIAPWSDDAIAHGHRSTREDNYAQQPDLLLKVSNRRS